MVPAIPDAGGLIHVLLIIILILADESARTSQAA